jgi:hypothetical protein
LPAAVANDVERGDTRNIDQRRGFDQPQIEHRHERLAAGKDARVVAVFGQRHGRLLDRVGAQVIERAGLHACTPRAFSISA